MKGLYRNVYTCIWGDATFRQFSRPKPNAQSLWIYLATGPHTSPIEGLISIREAVLADRLKWRVKDLRRCWAEIEVAGWGKADWDAGVVWLPSLLAEDKPCSHKNILGWKWELPNISECPLRAEACEAIVARCLERATEVASKSQNPMNILSEWRTAIARTFGGIIDTSRHGDDGASRGASDAPRDAPCDAGDKTNRNGNGKQKEKKNPPPTPRGGEEKSGGDSSPLDGEEEDEDERSDKAEADELARHYDATVKPLHCGKGATEILARLRDGEPGERLRVAAVSYAAQLDGVKKEPCYRQTAATFYGTGGTAKYATFRDTPPRSSQTSHPELVEPAQRLVALYRQVVCSPYAAKGEELAVLDVLASGVSEKRLTGAIRRYACDCNKRRLDNTARKGALAFFASAWQEYAPAESPPLQPYEPRAVLSKEELAARPGLAKKSALVDEHFFKHLIGDDRPGRPNSFIARMLLDGVPPIDLLAAAQGYARHAAKEQMPQNERILSPEFFVAEWQRWRTHPPDCWAKKLADELDKTEEQMAEELAAAWAAHEARTAKTLKMMPPPPVVSPTSPVVAPRTPEEAEYRNRCNEAFMRAVRGGCDLDAALVALDAQCESRPTVPTEPLT